MWGAAPTASESAAIFLSFLNRFRRLLKEKPSEDVWDCADRGCWRLEVVLILNRRSASVSQTFFLRNKIYFMKLRFTVMGDS